MPGADEAAFLMALLSYYYLSETIRDRNILVDIFREQPEKTTHNCGLSKYNRIEKINKHGREFVGGGALLQEAQLVAQR
ncbi:hypothetical protein DPMN_184838 [Dreissena polymorpha]|uniref:Uncharacterized protein n=1 Tax=Dreissena polymorpha TaxID=45954 RepID=A0A9D4DJZ5_DREPO|nr:hypothetical protein DPMN_184838 [Dreissena polymorpha]